MTHKLTAYTGADKSQPFHCWLHHIFQTHRQKSCMLPPSWQCASCPLKSCWQRGTGDVHPLGLFTSYLLLDVLLILSYSDVSRISRPSRKQAEWTENLSVDEDSLMGVEGRVVQGWATLHTKICLWCCLELTHFMATLGQPGRVVCPIHNLA